MHITDPIADMITRLRNANIAGLKYTTIPASILKFEITKILEARGMILGFRLIKDESGQGKIKIALKYTPSGSSVIKGLVRISKSSCRVYKSYSKLSPIRGGLGFSILSTSKGVMTCSTAKKEKVGGEVMVHVW